MGQLKLVLAVGLALAAAASQAQLAAPRTDLEMASTAKLGLPGAGKANFEAANRKGSHRVGGTNSKGKNSKYRGGRK